MSDILEKLGYNTFTCQRSPDAIEILKETGIDVIITDYYMPEINGMEFLKEVRKLPGYQSVPVIFLSSAQNPEDIWKDSDHNITAWLKKPVDIDLLSEAINKALIQ